MKRLVFALPALVLATVIALFGYGLTKDPSVIPSALIDRVLPAFALPGIDAGGGFASADFGSAARPAEPRLLNVFASWCAACPQEHAMLFRIGSEGFPVFGLDWKDEPAAAGAWLARLGNPYRRVASDPSARTGIDLGVTGVPETFVIDRRGRIRYKHVGPITAAAWEATLKPMLVRLRAEA